MALRSLKLLLMIAVVVLLAFSPTGLRAQEGCVDHGSIQYQGLSLGAVQCGDMVYFSNNTQLKVFNDYIFVRLGDDFFLYTPIIDYLMKVVVEDLEPIEG